ncbi:MAG: leucine-rich repeat domain-containing protein [Promethearchaeota archaeon]
MKKNQEKKKERDEKKNELKPEQAQALEDLEEILGYPISRVKEIVVINPGVKIDGGNITELNLLSGKLSALPESIGNLSSLKKLSLYQSQLSTLPESFGNLTSLKVLHITNSKLTKLPESFGNLTSLQELWLNGNKLSTLPESIRNLSSLQSLRLPDNKLSTLPESIGNLKSLQELKLTRNKLTNLPESIGNLTTLKELGLSNNELTTLPVSFWRLKNLERLFLGNNPWEGAWKGIEQYPAATVLERSWQILPIVVFLSHSKDDKEQYRVNDFKNELKGQEEICEMYSSGENDVLESQLVLFIATKNSMKSEQCRQELDLAKTYDIPIIPIKGPDIRWDDLKQIDLGTDFNLSDKLGIEFNKKNIKQFYDELYEHIKKYKHEVNLFESEGKILDREWLNVKTIVNKFVKSEGFREIYTRNINQFKKLNEELKNKQINPAEYFIKLSRILKKMKTMEE